MSSGVITTALTRLLGRLPIGWLQLTHKPGRMAAALAGVVFANILIFVQLGFLGALNHTTLLPYEAMQADILISASDANTLSDGSTLPRQRLTQAISTPGVATAHALHVRRLDWEAGPGEQVSLNVFGVAPTSAVFSNPQIADRQAELMLLDTVLVDRTTRSVAPGFFDQISPDQPRRIEASGRTLNIIDTFTIGAGFDADGYMVTSDETYLKLFPGATARAPRHVLVTVDPDVRPETVVTRLRQSIPQDDVQIRLFHEAAKSDQRYQTTERPIGVVFGFGTIIGVLVGIVIVYQVLSTDVADHLGEYATFKAMGYPQGFFLGIVFEEAVVLALLGFIPGLLASLGLYHVIGGATELPMIMTESRAIAVFFGTLGMCTLSGAIATRRLAAADPADLF